MRIPDIVRTANSNLRRSILRTALTMLAISIGTFTLAISLGLGQGMRSYIASQLGEYNDVNLYIVQRQGGNFGSGNPFSTAEPKEYDPEKVNNLNDFNSTFFTDKDIEDIKTVEGVGVIRVPYSLTFTYVEGSDNKKYVALAEQYVPEIPETVIAGGNIADNDLKGTMVASKFVPLIGAKDAADAVGKTVRIHYQDQAKADKTVELTVRGVFEPKLGEMPFKLNETYAKEISLDQKGSLSQLYSAVMVSKKDGFDETKLRENIKAKKLSIMSFAEFNAILNSIITAVQVALATFSSIAILASVVGVVNTLFMAVLERTKEIGLFRAVGARKTTIFALFSVEAVLIGFWGSAIGLWFAYMAQLVINTVSSRTFLKGIDGLKLLDITLPMVVGIVVVMAIVTLIAGLLPAFKASRLNPIDALKYE